MRFGFRLSSDDLPELKLNSLESHAQPFWCYTDVVPSLKSAEASEEDHECGLAVRRDLAASDLRTLDGIVSILGLTTAQLPRSGSYIYGLF